MRTYREPLVLTECLPMDLRVGGAMRIRLTAFLVAGLLARGAGAQSASQHPTVTTPVGTWRGTSVSLVRPSACKDEIVVYRIARTNAPDSLRLDAR